MKTSSHLSSIERDRITILQGEGLSIRKIAKELGRSPSTISRELHRPQAVYYRGKYIGSQTDKNVKRNWSLRHKRNNKYLAMYNVRKYISIHLKYGYSPAIISHLLLSKYGINISHETLYQYIYKKEKLGELFGLKNSIGKFSDSLYDDVPIDVSVTYDEKGRIIKREQIQTEEDSGFFFTDDASFHNPSQKQLITTNDNYQYDEKGNPISYNENSKNIVDGMLSREYNGTVCIDNQYDSNGRLIKRTEKHTNHGVDHLYTNEYNSNGDLIKHSEGYFGKAPSSHTTYEYDNNGKVVKLNGKNISEN